MKQHIRKAIFGGFSGVSGGKGKSGGRGFGRIFISLRLVVDIGVLVGFQEMDFWLKDCNSSPINLAKAIASGRGFVTS